MNSLQRLDGWLFPGLREKYERTYGGHYRADVPNAGQLAKAFTDLCVLPGIAPKISQYLSQTAKQLDLFG